MYTVTDVLSTAFYIKSHVIEEHLSLRGVQVRGIIRELRRDGVPIISNSKGYKLAANKEEFDANINSLKARKKSLKKTIRELEKYSPFN